MAERHKLAADLTETSIVISKVTSCWFARLALSDWTSSLTNVQWNKSGRKSGKTKCLQPPFFFLLFFYLLSQQDSSQLKHLYHCSLLCNCTQSSGLRPGSMNMIGVYSLHFTLLTAMKLHSLEKNPVCVCVSVATDILWTLTDVSDRCDFVRFPSHPAELMYYSVLTIEVKPALQTISPVVWSDLGAYHKFQKLFCRQNDEVGCQESLPGCLQNSGCGAAAFPSCHSLSSLPRKEVTRQ